MLNVVLNLINEFEKSNKMRGLLIILSFSRNEFNKFNNSRTVTILSIYTDVSRTMI